MSEGSKVQFVECTSSQRLELVNAGTIDDGTLYFCADTGELYKGDNLYSGTTTVSKDDVVSTDGVVKNINFVGKGFTVKNSGDGSVEVSMPFNLAKMTASNYNGTGGTTNPSVANISKAASNSDSTANTYQTRYVALPSDDSYSVGNWSESAERSVLNKDVTSISYNTADLFWLADDTTYFEITLTKGDGTKVVEKTESITGNGTYSTTNCSVVISDWSDDFMGYKAKAKITIGVSGMLGGAGRFSIKISHMIGSTAYSKEQNDLFYDDNSDAGSVGSGSIKLNNKSNTKYLSGVEYYTTGTTVDVTLSDVNGVFDKSFESSVGTIKTNCTANISYSASDVATAAGITLSNVKNNTTATTLTKTGVEVSANKYLTDIQFTSATCGNGWKTNTLNTSSTTSIDKSIDTYVSASTDLSEEFQDEDYRLQSDLKTPWDSTKVLTTDDLQVGKGTKLFSSDSSISQVYYRNFALSGKSTSNFTFTLSGSGLTEANLAARNFDLEISLDGVNWFTFSKDKEDVLLNGSGIREYKDSAKLSGTSGTLRGSFTAGMNTNSTSGVGGLISGYGIYARITIKGSDIELDSMSVTMV